MSSKRIEKLLSKMSMEDKVRQLTQINAYFIKVDVNAEDTGISGDMHLTASDIFGAGSVLNFGGAEDAYEVRSRHLKNNPNSIPLAMMQDVIHGYRTIFPIPLAIGCSFDIALAEECAQMSAREAAVNGVDVAFSPMVNLVRDARWGRVMETYGEDAYLNGLFGRATIRGYRAGGVASCVKHFAVYGAAEAGRDYNTTDVSEHTLREYYLKAFEECLKEEPEAVMTSFNLLNGIPVNADSHLLNDILRKEWGYDGVVVSDYGAVVEMINHGYAATQKECACISANNNIDLEMMTATYIHNLPDLVKEGKVSMATVDNMVRRVLELKEKLNLYEKPFNATDIEKAKTLCLSPEHREIARRAAENSFVLLENDGILPLDKGVNAAFVGPVANERNILGAWACAGRHNESVTVIEGVERLLNRKVIYSKGCNIDLLSTDESAIGAAVDAAKEAEVIVACIGEHSYCSGESASRTDISIPAVQIKLLERLKTLEKPIIAVVFGGRPQVLKDVKRLCNAILYVWQPGTEGGSAIANVLYGEVNPSGKLTISFPRSVGQCPIYYNHFNTGRPKLKDVLEGQKYSSSYLDELNSPQYPFGYGLSYTTFEYSTPQISSSTMKRGEKLTVQVEVANTGKREGAEVVQLYLRDKFASCARPVKELKTFSKVNLVAGEKRTVRFEIDEEMLKFYRADSTYGAEAGDFDVAVGSDSACKPFATFTLE